MAKYLLAISAIFILALTCCQENESTKQYYEQSPEIDIAKKSLEAYLNLDWETYRSCFSDTARIWHNKSYNRNPGSNINEVIDFNKVNVPQLVYYKYEGELWEMIVDNNGDKWVHFWADWIGKYSDEIPEIEIPVHIAYDIRDNKIVQEIGFWDNLPIYLALQELQQNN